MLKLTNCKLSVILGAITVGCIAGVALPAACQYKLVNLVANEKDLGHEIPQAANFDKNLVNAWGLAFLPSSPFWVTDEYTGLSSVYSPNGTLKLTITIPRAPSDPMPPGCPTGIVANPWGGFTISDDGKSGSALFLVVTLDGTISGWNPAVNADNAVIALDNSSLPAAYTGLDILHNSSGTFLYAVNAYLNRVEKYDSSFNLLTTFSDPNITYGVYGVSVIQNKVYVAYAPEFPGKPGAGAIDVFDTDGTLIKTLVPVEPNGHLNIPFGMAIAPANFGKFSNALLVGNLQDGRINAFDPDTGSFLGSLSDKWGNPIEVPGIWDFDFGGGNINNGATNELYFVAGPDTYYGGMLGKIVLDESK
jgi:uncharacterized protein (TIGR03118 family)